MRKQWVIVVAVMVLIGGCTSSSSTIAPDIEAPMDFADRLKASKKLDPHLIETSNQLGLKLLRELRAKEEGKNLSISPYSITAALALAYNGSAGKTAAELGDLLGYSPAARNTMNTDHKALLTLLNHAGSGIELSVANSIWGSENVKLRKDFLTIGKEDYEAEIRQTDLSSQRSVTEINKWVSKHTEDKIKKMLENPLGKNAVAVLVNAVYFKAGWRQVFLEENTRKEEFHPTSDTTVQVDMMKQSGIFLYAESENWQAIRLLYGDGQMDMQVILPNEDYSLNELQEELAQGGFQDSLFDGHNGELSLPRFTVSYGADLKDTLKALGVKRAFDPDQGDFSKLADTRDSIFINQLLHKTYINVNEQGTEAAASTLAAMLAGGGPPTDEPFKMVVNRPFFYVIRDNQTGVWLFLGAVENPLMTE